MDRHPRKHPCTWSGCPRTFVRLDYAQRHSAELHLTCTCGRNFTVRAFPAHVAGVTRHRIAHPAWPALPIGAVEASRRERRAA